MSETEICFPSNLQTENVFPKKTIPPLQVKWMFPKQTQLCCPTGIHACITLITVLIQINNPVGGDTTQCSNN